MELFEAIRREYQFGAGTVKGVARKFGVHRRMVREALADAVPKERKRVQRARPKLEAAFAFIDGILENDLKEPSHRNISNWPEQTPPNVGEFPQSHDFSQASFSNHEAFHDVRHIQDGVQYVCLHSMMLQLIDQKTTITWRKRCWPCGVRTPSRQRPPNGVS